MSGVTTGTEHDIRLYMILRLTMLYSVLVSTLGYQVSGLLAGIVTAKTYFVIFFTFLVTSAFVFLYEKTKHVRHFLASQIGYDILFTTALIFYTDAYDSIFTIFYLLNIIFCAILFKGRGAAIVAALISAASYSLIFTINSAGGSSDRYFTLLTTLTSFISMALLSGQLVEELRRSRQRISRLESLSEEIVDSLDSGLIGLDASGVIQRVNKTAQQMLGLKSVEAVIGRSLIEVLPGMSDASGQGAVREFGIGGRARRMLVTRVGLPERHSMILMRDITEVLDLEERLRRQERLAGVGRLAAGLAHEIRNPIASISGAAQLLDVESAGADERGRLTRIIVRESERVDRLVSQLLKFAKPTVGGKALIDMRAIVCECVEALRLRPDFQTVAPAVDVKMQGELTVNGRKDELCEVVSNLLVNAMQALAERPESEGGKRIAVEGRRSGGHVLVAVRDNGPGIPREFRGRIFDPFFTTKPAGTGLGLAQVHKIVRDHDGEIDIESELGRGTVLTVKLPA